MKTSCILGAGLLAALVAFPAEAGAQATRSLGSFKDWQAFTYDEAGKSVCFMASRPKSSEGDYTKRGDVYILVTHRPGEQSYNVVSVTAGYSHKVGSETVVQIDKETFKLFTEGEVAWGRDKAVDDALFKAIRSGSKLVVKATSARGTQTTDTYSLKGSSDAADAIEKACSR